MPAQLSKNFSYAFDGNIWNMLLDERKNYLILEIRDNENHQVSFTAIDLNNKDILWDGLSFGETWWLGLTFLKHNILLLHTYEDNVDPEPKGLIAFHILNKEVCWQQNDFCFLKIIGEEVIGYSTVEEEKRYKTVSLLNGEERLLSEKEMMERLGEEEKSISTAASGSASSEVRYPFHYKEGTPYFDTCKKFIYNRMHKEAVSAMDYLEVDNGILISYYSKEEKKLVNYLLVMELNGAILYHEPIQKNIDAVGAETFFIVKNQLIFVQNKNEIYSYTL